MARPGREPVFDGECEGRDPSLPVPDTQHDRIRPAGEQLPGYDALDRDPPQRRLREDSREHQESEHQREDEIEQVIARVQRGEADTEDDRHEAPARARRAQGPGRSRKPAAAFQSGIAT